MISKWKSTRMRSKEFSAPAFDFDLASAGPLMKPVANRRHVVFLIQFFWIHFHGFDRKKSNRKCCKRRNLLKMIC